MLEFFITQYTILKDIRKKNLISVLRYMQFFNLQCGYTIYNFCLQCLKISDGMTTITDDFRSGRFAFFTITNIDGDMHTHLCNLQPLILIFTFNLPNLLTKLLLLFNQFLCYKNVNLLLLSLRQ